MSKLFVLFFVLATLANRTYQITIPGDKKVGEIALSEKCKNQEEREGEYALLPGTKYNFRVQAPKQGNEIRIAVAGDSVTQGCCGTPIDELNTEPLERRLTDQTDGSHKGTNGWPYLLHSLLQNNNQSIDYTIMNFAVGGATILPGVKFRPYDNDCRSEQLQKSLPNFVFLAFGAMDSMAQVYTQEFFIDSYLKFIKEAQNMPTKPLVFLMVPTATCLSPQRLATSPSLGESMVDKLADCKPEQANDQQQTFLKIAEKAGIPTHHIVNGWDIIRSPNRQGNVYRDNVHATQKGLGEIAQQFFMQMSLSPEYLAKQDQILKGQDNNFKQAIQQVKSSFIQK